MKKSLIALHTVARKNGITIILSILVLILTISLIKTKNDLSKFLNQQDLRGTFNSAPEFSVQQPPDPNTQYFTFIDGEYYRYEQFNLIKKGSYQQADENVYLLEGGNTNESLVYIHDKLYYFDLEKNEIVQFHRISDIPTFINLNEQIRQ